VNTSFASYSRAHDSTMEFLSTTWMLWIFSAVLLASIKSTDGWGEEGHKIIAQLAWNRISQNSKDVAKSLMVDKSMTDIAPIPDTYRASAAGKWSEPCHFYDLPRVQSFSMQYCTSYCVIKSVTNYTKLLETQTKQNAVCQWGTGIEPCSLSFLVHYVGDVHQPLHVSYGDDRGGNSVKVKFFTKSTNLHSVWDTDIIQKWTKGVDSAVSQLEDFIDQNPDTVQKYLSATHPEDWAAESFGYVLSTVYEFDGNTTTTRPSKKFPKQDQYLGQPYYDRNLPIVQQRLVAGGVRLAQLLDSIL